MSVEHLIELLKAMDPKVDVELLFPNSGLAATPNKVFVGDNGNVVIGGDD